MCICPENGLFHLLNWQKLKIRWTRWLWNHGRIARDDNLGSARNSWQASKIWIFIDNFLEKRVKNTTKMVFQISILYFLGSFTIPTVFLRTTNNKKTRNRDVIGVVYCYLALLLVLKNVLSGRIAKCRWVLRQLACLIRQRSRGRFHRQCSQENSGNSKHSRGTNTDNGGRKGRRCSIRGCWIIGGKQIFVRKGTKRKDYSLYFGYVLQEYVAVHDKVAPRQRWEVDQLSESTQSGQSMRS